MTEDPHRKYHRALLAAEAAEDPLVIKARRVAAQLTYMADEIEAGEVDATRLQRIAALVDRLHNAGKGHRMDLASAAEDLVRAVLQASGLVPLDARFAELHLARLEKLYPTTFAGARGARRVTPAAFLVAARACAAAPKKKNWPELAKLCELIGYKRAPKDLSKEIARAKTRRRGG